MQEQALLEAALAEQLATLPTREVAAAALGNGFAVVAPDLDSAAEVCDRLPSEHLEVLAANAGELVARLRHYGALFVGPASGEVLGDYGPGPNHTCPPAAGPASAAVCRCYTS